MVVGIDTYSFHRLLGDVRPGEREPPPAARLSDGGSTAIERAIGLGAQLVALQTCFLDRGAIRPERLREAAGERQLAFSWGHPEGLAFATRPPARADLLAWLPFAAEAGAELVRIVVGGPRLRGTEPLRARISRTAAPLAEAAERAAELGIGLAVENHGDLTIAELIALLDHAAHPNLGICLDTANVARLGERLPEACAAAASRVRMIHLKDAELTAADPVAGPVSLPYGSGKLPLEAALRALAEPIAAGAPVCLEIGQVRPGDDEVRLLESGMRWLAEHRSDL